jgi:hypothetical protein
MRTNRKVPKAGQKNIKIPVSPTLPVRWCPDPTAQSPFVHVITYYLYRFPSSSSFRDLSPTMAASPPPNATAGGASSSLIFRSVYSPCPLPVYPIIFCCPSMDFSRDLLQIPLSDAGIYGRSRKASTFRRAPVSFPSPCPPPPVWPDCNSLSARVLTSVDLSTAGQRRHGSSCCCCWVVCPGPAVIYSSFSSDLNHEDASG